MRVVVAGTFDLFHEGHAHLVNYAKLVSEDVILCVNSDNILKGRKTPAQKQEERVKEVREYSNTKVYLVHSFKHFTELLENFSPCFLLHGNDWNRTTLSKLYGVEENWWEDNKVFLLYKDRTPGISSSKLREEMKK